jgi:hypothetical protein
MSEENMLIKKAIIKTWSSGAYTATIQIAGTGKAYLEGVAVARNIPSAEMQIGRKVAVIFWDKNNTADAVIVAVYA